MALNKIDSTNLKDDLLITLSSPRITSIVYSGNDTAADPAGGQTITLRGGGFSYGAVVKVNGSNVAATTLVDFTTITFTSPAIAAGSYSLQVVNGDGGTATASFSYVSSSLPTWSTASGSIGNTYEANTITPINLSASSDSSVTFSLTSGSLPGGLTLASNGLISGTLSTLASSTTYSFTVDAIDAELQNTSRSFTFTVNADSVTFSTSNNITISTMANSVMTTNTMVATSASGRAITYSVNSLPTGISINATSGAITGTPTVEGNTITLVTATANSTNKTANITVNFNITPYAAPNFTASYLLVAGGGAGGPSYNNAGGGGGGGGFLTGTANLVNGTTYTVTVGGGGASALSGNLRGSNSVISGSGFSTLTAIGGGGSGTVNQAATSGGSGGGAAGENTAYNTIQAAGTSGQGYAGGYNASSVSDSGTTSGYGNGGAGGGGAGQVGTNIASSFSNNGKNGGSGLASNIRNGSDVAYAGGGGGGGSYGGGRGLGGSGGGGNGYESRIASFPGSPGTINTGGGGGGGGSGEGGGSLSNGGSGIVIISYPSPQKFTGGTITTLGSNTIHTFTTSGSLVPA